MKFDVLFVDKNKKKILRHKHLIRHIDIINNSFIIHNNFVFIAILDKIINSNQYNKKIMFLHVNIFNSIYSLLSQLELLDDFIFVIVGNDLEEIRDCCNKIQTSLFLLEPFKNEEIRQLLKEINNFYQ